MTRSTGVKVGIVGHEGAKFTPETESKAREIIRRLVSDASLVVSGHCHLGGIDIWAEEESAARGIPYLVYPPRVLAWPGYRDRNLQIAAESDIVHCIVVRVLPESYDGMRFRSCYHCQSTDHVKSGGCWTAKRAKKAEWHIV